MALRAVTDHPKFFRLKGLLRLNKSCALGYLEAMWHFCGKYTPQGNLGKYDDVDIEAWLEWDGDEGALIAAFVKAGWVGTDDTHRLIVHDWSQYADETVHTDLARRCILFADGSMPKNRRLNSMERARFRKAFPEVSEVTAESDDNCAAEFADCLHGGADSLPQNAAKATVPEPVPVPEPDRKASTPQPPSSARGAVCLQFPEADRDANAAVAKVLRECRWVDSGRKSGMGRVVRKAMELEHSRTDEPPDWNGTAERMIGAWTVYKLHGDDMAYNLGPGKFLRDGLWADDKAWPWDSPRLALENERRNRL